MWNPDQLSIPLPNYNATACGCLARRRLDKQELLSLIDAAPSNKGRGEMVRSLSAGDAQMLIDVMDEVHSAAACHYNSAY